MQAEQKESHQERRRRQDEVHAVYYGPCAKCERWTQHVSKDEPGLCRYCKIGDV
jgi:hypothetical protein